MREGYQVIRRPVITEKTNLAKDSANQFVFEVMRDANKVEIRKAVEELFNVTVVDVQTMVINGKTKRVGRNMGKRKTWKKALVKLAAGETIDFFEGA
ncbi:MAG: 50S ribosomal protein L23 [Candidatus Alcyoniella australis]|nr:50S ribosomal protein L23 [Candidatus Alcyoniella australis]